MPLAKAKCLDHLVGNSTGDNSRYCLAVPGEVYVVYLPTGGVTELDLAGGYDGTFTIKWYNPRTGGSLLDGSVKTVNGSAKVSLGQPPQDPESDWVVLIR
jgi:hypothetical protein